MEGLFFFFGFNRGPSPASRHPGLAGLSLPDLKRALLASKHSLSFDRQVISSWVTSKQLLQGLWDNNEPFRKYYFFKRNDENVTSANGWEYFNENLRTSRGNVNFRSALVEGNFCAHLFGKSHFFGGE